ncbi:MAG: SDR family oxidoreductase [Bacteroidales bacterium]|nr:SDR family oxidoreductase [Bacteroidales bacterium]MBN2747888.1 SDR family oxidoreductase [Bacteroidales bacterium]
MNIVITGASRGIGFETAKRLASLGDNNIVAISRDEAKLKELKNACIRENVQAHLYPIPFNLEDTALVETQLLAKVKQYVTSIDIIINNAGALVNRPFELLAAAEMLRMINVNLMAPALVVKTLLPMLSRPAHVVNISSMGGFQGSVKFPGLSMYSATKAGLASLTECLAEEFKDKQVSFNCLALGAVQTEMLGEAFPGLVAPLRAHEMAELVADFAINGNRFFNGKVIPVSKATP